MFSKINTLEELAKALKAALKEHPRDEVMRAYTDRVKEINTKVVSVDRTSIKVPIDDIDLKVEEYVSIEDMLGYSILG